jgi:hypothetical protein
MLMAQEYLGLDSWLMMMFSEGGGGGGGGLGLPKIL